MNLNKLNHNNWEGYKDTYLVDFQSTESEFNEFEPRLKSAKNWF